MQIDAERIQLFEQAGLKALDLAGEIGTVRDHVRQADRLLHRQMPLERTDQRLGT